VPIRRPEPRSGDDRVGNQGRFCNIVGGVISPLLANAYLHEVLDEWFERTVKPRLKGRASLIRYADDLVICCRGTADEAMTGV
jgi:retron-type reverse transcriptase